MTTIDKQELLERLYEELNDALHQVKARTPRDDGWREYRGRSAAFNYVIQYVNSLPDDEPISSKFKVGDRVKSTSGLYAGEKGIITFLNKNYPNFCRVQYDGYKGETGEFTARIELLPAEPAQRTIHCGLCGHKYEVATEFQSATIKCDCGADLDYFKFDDGRISITATTTEVKR